MRRALVAATITALVLVGCSIDTSEPKSPHTSSFNDGFADSKQDDCEMGFQPACSWLAQNH
jgi:hypothetical protein